MTAITLKLSDLIVSELKQVTKTMWITQKKAVEESLRNWLVSKKKQMLIKQMNKYAIDVSSDGSAEKEEMFLLNSLNDDYDINLTKEDNA